jgi:hypothetical protein
MNTNHTGKVSGNRRFLEKMNPKQIGKVSGPKARLQLNRRFLENIRQKGYNDKFWSQNNYLDVVKFKELENDTYKYYDGCISDINGHFYY